MTITPPELLAVTGDPMGYWSPATAPMMDAHLRMAKMRAEQMRLFTTAKRMQFLEDDWKDLLITRLREIYTSASVQASIGALVSTEHNVYKRINTELSTVYRYGVTRELKNKKQEEIARQLWDETQIDERLEKANYFTNGLRDLLLAPIVVDGKMQIWIITPDRTVVVQHPDDPTQAIAFMTERVLQSTPGYITIQRVYADAEKWVIGSTRNQAAKEVYHNLGRLPAVVVHASQRYDSFFQAMEGEDLADAAIGIGVDIFRLGRILKLQSELQPTFNGSPRKLARGMGIGGEQIWAAEGQFGVLNTQADPEKLIKTINARIGWISESYGLAADVYDLSSNATSGFQTRMKRLPLLEARQKQIKVWDRVEHDLIMLMAQVSQGSHPTLKLDPMAVDFQSLVFHDEPGLTEPLTQNRIWRERNDLGLMSRVEIRMAFANETREEALLALRRIQAEDAEFAPAVAPNPGHVGPNGPGQQGPQGAQPMDEVGAENAIVNPGTAPPKQVGNQDFGPETEG